MKTAIIDERVPYEAERSLVKHGFFVLRAPKSKYLPAPLASHPDMLMCKIGNTVISYADYVEEAPSFFDDLANSTSLSFKISDESPEEKYPRDCIYNALLVADKLFCKKDSVSGAILSHALGVGLNIINTNQGYPACTVLALGERYAVTADHGMAAAMQDAGIDVTLIENGSIALPPYEYGFIGGAAGVFEDTVYFLGNPSLHPSWDKISDAIRRAGLRSVALSDTPLCDFGRIIFAK